MNLVKSTLVPSSTATKKVCSFKTIDIIGNYKDLGIDVSRYFKGLETISLYKCLETGFRFYHPPQIIGDGQFYEDLSKTRKGYYSDRWEHNETLKYLSQSDSILEVGSGFGAFLSKLKKKGIKGKGLELNKIAVHTCLAEGLEVEHKLIEDLEVTGVKYNVVCYFQVLEHIYEVHNFIKNSIEVLESKGKLIFGVPNNNPYLFISDKNHTLNLPPHHAGLWNKKAIQSLVNVFPIELIQLEFEPLAASYGEFLSFHTRQNSNSIIRFSLKVCNKFVPKLLKRSLCFFLKGRNILAIFQKK
ncbi:methyltransferase domain-containing protein [Bizionia saleffrena]|uniref:Methyltransferase domain-containing protein n=1 Tax=Bizionia saleffrena TaxID=291189 RepID=A0A8H2LHF2_9FLAO|nr:methyltransferase domain-containing protein [Bizionia saleffrena]TYB80173.1 methyltransferase domain-containing protein [Bizionia saleffrena]